MTPETFQRYLNVAKASKRGVATCETCQRDMTIYKRPIYGSMAEGLLDLAKLSKGGTPWIHFETALPGKSRGGDFAKLAYFGLIEERPPGEGEGKHSGSWRMTAKGYQFVRGEATVPKYATVFLNEVVGFAEHHTTFREALDRPFDINEINYSTAA